MVERARLENELGVKAYVGSNPTLPATLQGGNPVALALAAIA